MWRLGIELGSSEQVASALKHLSISIVPEKYLSNKILKLQCV